MNLVMLLEMAADTFPDRIAVRSGEADLSYGMLQRAAWTAARIFEEGGCRHVGLLDTNSLAVPIAIFGAAYAGVPYVPLNYRLTAPELNELVARIAPAMLIAGEDYAASIDLPPDVRMVATDAFTKAAFRGSTPRAVAEAASETAIQLFTSGTTGRPKAALLRHENLMSYILGTVEFSSATEDEALLVTAPPYHIAGISSILSSTYACRRMVQLPNFDAQEWLRLCREEAVTNAFLVPTMLARIVNHIEESGENADLPAMRAIAYGGGKMPLPVIEKAICLWPHVDFTNAYGLTETSSTIALLGPDDHRDAIRSDDPAARKRLGSVGRPLPTVELEVRDDNGNPAAPGQSGLIFVRGEQVAGEYLGLGSQLDPEGWFPTKDRGYIDEAGFLFLEGRDDDVIVRGGENISPGEVEDVLLEHTAVAEAAVVAVPDMQWGEAVAAAIVLKDGKAAGVEELQEWVRQRLRSSRVPVAIRFLEQLPYNETGKLLRRLVRQELSGK